MKREGVGELGGGCFEMIRDLDNYVFDGVRMGGWVVVEGIVIGVDEGGEVEDEGGVEVW